jgi:4-amino-4-deoxy-L-arabinose transferase-like glycosyltransferase
MARINETLVAPLSFSRRLWRWLESQTTRRKSFFIFLASLTTRWMYCLWLVGPTVWSDTPPFINHAKAILSGAGYGLPDRPPAFPVIAAAIISLGGNENLNFAIYQVILSAITSALIYLIGRALYTEITGLMAGGLSIIYFPLIDMARLIGSDTQFIFLMVLTAWVLSQSSAARVYMLGGVLLGITCLTRGSALAASPLIGLLGLTRMGMPTPFNQRLIGISAMAAAAAITLAPWTIRNWIEYQSFVPVSSEGGLNFLQGTQPSYLESRTGELDLARQLINDPNANHYTMIRPEHQAKLMNYWWQMWVTDPLNHLHLRLISFADFWSPVERVRYYSIGISTIYSWAIYAGVLYFFVIGACLTVREQRAGIYFILGSILGVMILHTLTHAEQNRYRLQVEPFIIIIAMYGIERSVSYYHAKFTQRTG